MDNIKQNKKFFDNLAKYYDSFLFKSLNENLPVKIIRIIKIKKSSKILDAGCGTGNLLEQLSQQKKHLKLYGIDISPEMLKIAKQKLKGKADLKQLSVEELKDKNKFEYIFSVDAFHHYSSQKKAMRSFYRALKKNGKLIVVELDFGFLLNRIFHWLEPGNSEMNSAVEIMKIFEAYGFKDVKQKKIGWFSWMTIGEK